MNAGSTTQNASTLRLILGSLLLGVLAYFHFNFLLQGKASGWLMLVVIVGVFWISKQKEKKALVQKFQYKTASILSFLLPVSAFIYSVVFTDGAVRDAGSEAEQAGTAIGSVIGGGIVVGISFIVGLSLGITLYIMSRKGK